MEAVIGVLENHTSFVPLPAQGAPRYRCDFFFLFLGGAPRYYCNFFWGGGRLRAITVMDLGMRCGRTCHSRLEYNFFLSYLLPPSAMPSAALCGHAAYAACISIICICA
jgi:hypothetical protein